MTRAALLVLLLLAGCGERARARLRPRPVETSRDAIIGGITDPGHWYVVMVGDSTGGFCSGSLVSKRTVITAGHCWGVGPDAITHVYFDHGTPLRRTRVTAVTSVRHPGYDEFSLTNDLAMVQLAVDAPVQPVPLLRETLGPPFIGPSFTWVGYGDTDNFGSGFGTRRVITFPIQLIGPQASIPVPQSAPSGASQDIDATQFWFKVANKNTCTGDSGGPGLVVRNRVERHAGITSFGDDECAYDGVSARTDAARMTWIQGNIDAWEPGSACRSDGVCGGGCVATTPAPLGRLDDPDCADQHCGGDGVCVISCSPVDPDCQSLGIETCRPDGVCGAGCASPDPDCPAGAGGGSGAGGGGGGGTTGTGGGSASGAGGSGGAASGSGGSGGGGTTVLGPVDEPRGCSSAGGFGGLAIALTLWILGRQRRWGAVR